jgi:putative transposase
LSGFTGLQDSHLALARNRSGMEETVTRREEIGTPPEEVPATFEENVVRSQEPADRFEENVVRFEEIPIFRRKSPSGSRKTPFGSRKTTFSSRKTPRVSAKFPHRQLVPELSSGTRLSRQLRCPTLHAMRSRYRILEPDAAHFITGTVVEWLPIFTTSACCDILVHALLYGRTHRQLQVHAWVILDTHFHPIVSGPDLAQTLQFLRRHTARALLGQIEKEGRHWLLNQLACCKSPHKAASQYQVWREGLHPHAISGDGMMLQKLDYIHNNPVQRGLVVTPEHWRYSSAHEWLQGASPVFRCDPWR